MFNQLSDHFETIFNTYLAAFRKGFGCQTTLLRLLEDWKRDLDNHRYVGAILMDLSKAFDCLPHGIIIEKLAAYGLSDSACSLLQSYLLDRKQMVKLGQCKSTFLRIIKGVPQGSILGPLLFNVFLNDIFYFVKKSGICNYADDNTVTYSHPDPLETKRVLTSESEDVIEWFDSNHMQANPGKFQAFFLGKRGHGDCESFTIQNHNVKCEDSVKLLGVTIDYMLNFDLHISDICKKAAKQINVLSRLSQYLTTETKLLIYKSFVRSNFGYCPIVWHFCSKTSTDKMEKLQYRALRQVYSDFDSSYEELLKRANMNTLKLTRIRKIALETFKILNNLSPSYILDLVKFKSTNYSFRYQNLAELPRVNTESYGRKSFRYEAAHVWNSLPNELRTTTDFKEFGRLIRTWEGTSCKCSMCKFNL